MEKMKSFGEHLKTLRKAVNLTQTMLADKLNIHPQTVSKWERDLSRPDISQLGELAAVLRVTLEKLCGQEETGETFTGSFDAVQMGKQIGIQRVSRGESQEQLAEALRTSTDAISRWERGITCPDIEQLTALSAYFGMPVSRLYCAIGEEEKTETVVLAKKQRRILVPTIAAIAIVMCAVLFLLMFFLRPSVRQYTVTVDGNEITVNGDEWFTPSAPVREGYDFVCWTNEEGETITFPQKIMADVSYTSVFTPHEYVLEYWLNGGFFEDTVQNGFTVEGGTIELPVPKKTGQTFEGWFLLADYSGEAVERIECTGEDLTLYAKWSDAVYTVRYQLNGGVLHGEENPESVTADRLYNLREPVRKGYVFLGWYDQPYGGEKHESVGGDLAKNVTLYALWQKCDDLFTVYYDLNDGTPEGENPVSVGAGEVYKLNGASKTGYTFLGWNTQEDGGGEYVEYLYGVDDTLCLYAVFEPKSYVIRYIFEGGYEGEETNPNTVVYGDSVALLPVELYGHEFIGWYDAEEGGNKIDAIDTGNILTFTTLYARFRPLRFMLTLQTGGGTVEGGVAEYTVGFDESLRLPACEREGHDFLGWNERADGTGTFYTVFTGAEGDRELYAVYAPKEYLVRYEYEGMYESGKVNPNYITYGETVVLYPVYRTGYVFAGWYDAEEGGARVEVIDENNILKLTWLFARFDPQEFEVTLDAGGGSFVTPVGTKTVYTYVLQYGQTFELPLCTREGYAFLGWFDADGSAIAEITSLNIKEMTLTADWMQTGVEYRIEYILDGGTMEEANPDTALSDVSATLHDPVREGYLFLGWYDNPDGAGGQYLCTPFGRMDDLTLYALWQEIKVSGSVEFFEYEKTDSEVTILAYTGPTGANVDVSIPSVVDGLPVTQIGSNIVAQVGVKMVRYSIFGAPDSAEIRSLTIPEGVLVLKENAFRTLKVSEPLQLPSTVERIESGCFQYYKGDIIFSEDGNLTYIGQSAFFQVRFTGTLVIPHGVKIIDKNAFCEVQVCGVILPDTVEMIFDFAFNQSGGNIDRMYIPASVKYIGFGALSGVVYTALSEEQVTMFASWGGAAVYSMQKSTVTLCDGETRQTLYSEAFALPSPQKEGYTFLGWQDEGGEFVGDCYIPNRNATLTAVYEKQSERDGRTLGRAALLETDTTYEFILLDGQAFYFRPDLEQSCRILISVKGEFRWGIYCIRGNMAAQSVQGGNYIDYLAGDVYYVMPDLVPSGTAMTVKIILL